MSDFDDKLAKAREKLKKPELPAPSLVAPVSAAPVVLHAPAVTFMASKRSHADDVIDGLISGLDIVTAYNKYANKGTVDATGKTEGIMIRCPNPAHRDMNPSAWINTDKQTWFCGGCQEGGDKLDIAAWKFGMPVPGYKDGKNFHDLRRMIAEEHGYLIQRTLGGDVAIAPGAPAPVIAPPMLAVAPPVPAMASVGTNFDPGPPRTLRVVKDSDPTPPADDLADVIEMPGELSSMEVEDIALAWRSIIVPDTFLDKWMRATTIDDVPEEYHFWNGLLAISMALGRDATLKDFRPVFGNLFVCILGGTGSGKSKSKYYLDNLLESALPYKSSDPHSKGTLKVSGIASAEALIMSFQKKVSDPLAATGTPPKLYPVRGLIDYSELSSLVGRGQRAGNVLVPTMMQFFDVENSIETISRTHGVERAEFPYASAITTSQPKSLRNLVTVQDAASGFLNRWFFAGGKEKKREAIGGVVVDVSPAINPLVHIHNWAKTVGEIPWSQEGEELFTKFFYEELQPTMRKDDTDLLKRLDLLCKKLVLLFTANMRQSQVSKLAVEQMMQMYPYLIECYGVPGAHVGNSTQHEIREAILRVVVEHQTKTGMGATMRDITRRLSRRKYPLDLFNRTVKYMTEIEELIVIPMPTSAGRPTSRFGVADVTEWNFNKKGNSAVDKDEAVS